jgi:hypothetical protein
MLIYIFLQEKEQLDDFTVAVNNVGSWFGVAPVDKPVLNTDALNNAFDGWLGGGNPEPGQRPVNGPHGRRNSKTGPPPGHHHPPVATPASNEWSIDNVSAWLGIPGTQPQQQQPKPGERRRPRPPGSPGARGPPPRPSYGAPPGYPGSPPPGYGSPVGVGPFSPGSPYASRPGAPTSPRGPGSPRGSEGRYSQRGAPPRASPVVDPNDWTAQVGAWLTTPVSDTKL